MFIQIDNWKNGGQHYDNMDATVRFRIFADIRRGECHYARRQYLPRVVWYMHHAIYKGIIPPAFEQQSTWHDLPNVWR